MHFRYFIVEILFTANKLLLVLVAYIKITFRKLKIFPLFKIHAFILMNQVFHFHLPFFKISVIKWVDRIEALNSLQPFYLHRLLNFISLKICLSESLSLTLLNNWVNLSSFSS